MPRGKPISKYPKLYTKSKKVVKHIQRRHYKPQIVHVDSLAEREELLQTAVIALDAARANVTVGLNIVNDCLQRLKK